MTRVFPGLAASATVTVALIVVAFWGSVTAARQPATAAVTFTVDGNPKQFDSLPDGHNTYTPLASTLTARPSGREGEQLMITFLSMDLRKLTYPVELPVVRKPGQAMDPRMAMARVGFSYRDETGREWAGSGRIRLESFGRDGVVTGTFMNVSLPHTGKALPNVALDAGSFRIRISAPW